MNGTNKNIFPDHYRDIIKIGEGGTAEIFLAKVAGRQLPAALKLFRDPADEKLVEREISIGQKLNFPGIVKIEKAGTATDGRYFLQMEYCAGPTLENLPGKVSEEKLLSILSATAVSLEIMHRSGFSHNDLKPSNLFAPVGFDREDISPDHLYYLKLVDFSLAGRFSGNNTDISTGTVGFMSPEMILKKEITPASDLFNLGVMAYYLACGRMPFGSPKDDPLEVNARITEGERPAMCGAGETFSQKTAELIDNLMAIDPNQRPKSAFALQERLDKTGSPYPFRQAIRPRHLIWSLDDIESERLTEIFGRGSFSSEQIDFIRKTTGFDKVSIRLVLEYNFERQQFTRLEGKWGWNSPSADTVIWPPGLSRFILRHLRGKPKSCINLAQALTIMNDPDETSTAAEILFDAKSSALKWWQSIPRKRQAVLKHSLSIVMSPSARKILSGRLADIFLDYKGREGLTGRLLYDAGKLGEAVEYLYYAADEDAQAGRYESAVDFLDMAAKATRSLNDGNQYTNTIIRRARLFKEQGQLAQARDGYIRAIELAEKYGLKNTLALAHKELGDIYKGLSDYNSGITSLNKALELFRDLNDTLELSRTLNNLGNIYWVSGKNDQAMEEYKKALDIQTRLDSQKDIASSLSNIGSLYLIKANYEEGISYLNRSLVIKERLGDKVEMARTWNNLGVANHLKGDLRKAIEAYKFSLDYNRQAGDRNEQLLNITNLTEAMIISGRLTEALTYLKEGSTLAEEVNNDHHRSTISELTGTLLRRMGFYGEAESKLSEALEKARRLDSRTPLIGSLISMARLHCVLGEFDTAWECHKTAKQAALAIGDKNALFNLALVQLELTGDVEDARQAENLGKELDTVREMALYHLTCIETNNRRQVTENSKMHLTVSGRYFDNVREDIDLARYLEASGQYYLLQGQHENAEAAVKRSLIYANKLSLLPEQWHASSILSEISFNAGDYETSFSHAQNATAVLKKIAARVGDQERLGRLYSDRRIVELLERIKSLQEIVGINRGVTQG